MNRAALLERYPALRRVKAVYFLWVLFFTFLVLSFLVHTPGVLTEDLEFTQKIQRWQSPTLDYIARAITTLGNTWTLLGVGVFATAGMLFLSKRVAALMVWLSLGSLLLNLALKYAVGRPRPDAGLVSVLLQVTGLSFPSGHAMASATVYGFLAVLAYIHVPRPRLRLALVLACGMIAVLVGFSRVYLGAHWLSDVFGGWTAGALLVALLAQAYRKWGTSELPGTDPMSDEPT